MNGQRKNQANLLGMHEAHLKTITDNIKRFEDEIDLHRQKRDEVLMEIAREHAIQALQPLATAVAEYLRDGDVDRVAEKVVRLASQLVQKEYML